MTRLALAFVLLALGPVHAQAGLRIHEAVTADAPGDTTGMVRMPLASVPGGSIWVGRPVLDLPPSAIRTVGLEGDLDGSTVLTLWLSEGASATLADVTAAAVGRALAVVHGGRVLTAPRVASSIPNGLVTIAGLSGAEVQRLAAVLRESPTPEAEPREPSAAASPTRPPAGLTGDGAEAAALAFVGAVAGRRWVAAADALHPDARAAIRPDALGLLRIDGATVRVRDGLQEGTFEGSDVLGRRVASLDALGDADLAALYLAGLDALGVWGPPAPTRQPVGQIADGAHVHVLLRAGETAEGVSALTVVTLRRDGAGRWRALLTETRGF